MLPSIREVVLKNNKIFDFRTPCLKEFRLDLLNNGLSDSLLEETFFDRISNEEYFNYIISENESLNKYDDLLLKANLINMDILFSNSKNTATKEDLFYFVLATAIVSYKKIETIEKAINYPKFTEIFKKHFSNNERDNIQFFMNDAVIVSIVTFNKIEIMKIDESNGDEIDSTLSCLF